MGKGKRGKGEKVKIWLTPSKHASKLHTSLSLSTYSLFPYYLLITPILPTTYSLTTYFLTPYYLLLISLLLTSYLLTTYFLNPLSLKLNSQDISLPSPLGEGLGVRPEIKNPHSIRLWGQTINYEKYHTNKSET